MKVVFGGGLEGVDQVQDQLTISSMRRKFGTAGRRERRVPKIAKKQNRQSASSGTGCLILIPLLLDTTPPRRLGGAGRDNERRCAKGPGG